MSQQQKKKPSAIIRYGGGFLMIMGAIAIIGTIVMPSGANGGTPSPAQPSTTPASAPTPNYTPFDINHVQYWGKTVSGVTFVIYQVRVAPTLVTPFQVFHTQGHFVIVKLVVENDQKSAVVLGDAEFRLISPSGVRYSASSDDAYLHHSVSFAQMNPGIPRMIQAAFNVPSYVPVSSLKFRAQGGMTGAQTTLPLRPLQGVHPPA
jgi:hypothetical protein